MSVGSIVGAVVGAVVGFFIGGPLGAVYGASIGFGIGTIVDPITPDVPPPGRPQVGKLVIPTAEEGIAIADVLGTTKMTGNILWYANNRTVYVEQQQQEQGKGGFGGMAAQALDQTGQNAPGYHYYLTYAVGLSIGPVDTLYTVYKGEECVWEGVLDIPESGGEETIVIPDIGNMTFFFGTTDQVAPAAMTNLLTDATLFTNYRRLCYAFFNDIYMGQYNRLPVFRFVYKKSPVLTFNSDNEMETYFYNPAHAIWYILTQMIGLDEQYLNIFTFDTAAEKLFLEDRGVNVTFDRQVPALTYLQILLAHIDGVLRWSIDGRLHLKLMRSDEKIEDMLSVNEDMMLDDLSFQRKSWLDTQNEIKVQYPLLVVGDCELCLVEDTEAPVLALISQNGSVGSYEITEGCEPFLLYYRLSSSSFGPWVFARTVNRNFNGLASHATCSEFDQDREMKVVDSFGRESGFLDIKLRGREPLIWGGNPTVDVGSGSTTIDWFGGAPPFRCNTYNPLLTFDTQFYSQFRETNHHEIKIYFTDQLCGLHKITVQDDCGRIVIGYILIDANFAWDGGSSDSTIDPNDTAVQLWTDGIGPYDVELTGDFEDMWLNAGLSQTSVTTGGQGISVHGGPGACGEATVEVTDSCGITVFGTVTSSEPICCNGEVGVSFVGPPETSDPSDTFVLTIQDGVPPYTWSILVGNGHFFDAGFTQTVVTEDPSLTQTVHTNSGACGPVTIKVVDVCGNQAVHQMKCTDGGWDSQAQGTMGLVSSEWQASNQPPPPNNPDCDPTKSGQRFCIEVGGSIWSFRGGGNVIRPLVEDPQPSWWNHNFDGIWLDPPAPCDTPTTCNLDGCTFQDRGVFPPYFPCDFGGNPNDWICYTGQSRYYIWTCSGIDIPPCPGYSSTTTV